MPCNAFAGALPLAPFSPTLARAWERLGYQIATSRRLVSMELKDGRKVSVPVNETRLQFVGDRTY